MYHWGNAITAGTGLTMGMRIDRPPPAGARIDLPASMGARFAIFADAEEEFDWSGTFRRDQVDTAAIDALPAANRFFTDRGCVPTYLVDWPVVDNANSAAVIRDLATSDACDMGTQLHPWVNPPFAEAISVSNSFVGNLPRALEHAKIVALTDRITEVVGMRPTCYRAGRYGVGPNTATILAEIGYRLDVSTRALFDYSHEGGPDFRLHPVRPWRISERLVEVPLTAAYTGLLRRWPRLPRAEAVQGALARLNLLDRVPLTPEGVRLRDARVAIRRLLDDGHRLFSLSFHTPSVVPGHTPYVRTARDLETFWAWWDGVFDTFEAAGVKPIRSSEITAAFDAQTDRA